MDEKILNEISEHLKEIYHIKDKNFEKDKILGNKFNIFRILKKGHEEVSLHSAFIKELLDPKGCHNNGSLFLSLFLDLVITDPRFIKSNINEYTVAVEKSFEFGRMDIILENEKLSSCIIIENKINAEDQDEQLARYYQYAMNLKYTNIKILYLNLWGTSPSSNSLSFNGISLPENVLEIISYKENIIAWLEKCLLVVLDKSFIRENIRQYIDLLKELTDTMENNLNMEIKDYIKDKISINALNEINTLTSALDDLRLESMSNYLNNIKNKIEELNPNYIVETVYINQKAKKPIKWDWDVPGYLVVKLGDNLQFKVIIWTEFGKSSTGFILTISNNTIKKSITEKFNINFNENNNDSDIFNIDGIDFYNSYSWLKGSEIAIERVKEKVKKITDFIAEL